MTTYRTIQGVRDKMVELQTVLQAAVLAESTRDMGKRATEALAIVDSALRTIRGVLAAEDSDESDTNSADHTLLRAAERALNQSWDRGERVALGSSLSEMRERVLDFKTHVDFADAYVVASLGTDR